MRVKFKAAGIRTAAKLLEEAKTAKGRQALAEKTDIDVQVPARNWST